MSKGLFTRQVAGWALKGKWSGQPARVVTNEPLGYPTKVVALYHLLYTESDVNLLREYYFPSNVNVVNLSFAFGDPLAYPAYTDKGMVDFLKDLEYLRSRGVRIVASIGGSGNLVNINDTDAFCDQFMALNDIFPLDGIDWDLEGDYFLDATKCRIISQELVARRGPKFAVTFAPNGSNVLDYLAAAKACQDVGILSMYGQQFYDAPVSQVAMTSRMDQAIGFGIKPENLAIGMMVDEGIVPDGHWDIPTAISRATVAKERVPKLRGGYLWVQRTDTVANEWADKVGQIWLR